MARVREIVIDNKRPSASNYPHFRKARYRQTSLIVRKGQYIVDDRGDVMIVTSPNRHHYPNDFLRSINQGYLRAKYIGNNDDLLEFANRIRLATVQEIQLAKQYKAVNTSVLMPQEQLALL